METGVFYEMNKQRLQLAENVCLTLLSLVTRLHTHIYNERNTTTNNNNKKPTNLSGISLLI